MSSVIKLGRHNSWTSPSDHKHDVTDEEKSEVVVVVDASLVTPTKEARTPGSSPAATKAYPLGPLATLRKDLEEKDSMIKTLQKEVVQLQTGLAQANADRDLGARLLQALLRTETFLEPKSKGATTTSRELFRTIDILLKGAHRLQVEEMADKAVAFATTVLAKDSSYALAVLAALDSNEAQPSLEQLVLQKIRANPNMLLREQWGSQEFAWQSLRASRMEALLSDDQMHCDEATMFAILLKWVEAATDLTTNPGGKHNDINQKLAEDRVKTASEFISKNLIKMHQMDPVYLTSDAVRRCGFVNDTHLVDALAVQAKFARPHVPSYYKRAGNQELWNKGASMVHQQLAGGYNNNIIVGRTLTAGTTTTWRVRIEECTKESVFFLGIANASTGVLTSLRAHHVGRDSVSWGVSSKQSKFWKGRSYPVKELVMGKGSVVTLTLTLATTSDDPKDVIDETVPTPTTERDPTASDDDDNASAITSASTSTKGTNNNISSLKISVDNKPAVTVFSGDQLVGDGSGFVPAATLQNHCAIRFLGYKD